MILFATALSLRCGYKLIQQIKVDKFLNGKSKYQGYELETRNVNQNSPLIKLNIVKNSSKITPQYTTLHFPDGTSIIPAYYHSPHTVPITIEKCEVSYGDINKWMALHSIQNYPISLKGETKDHLFTVVKEIHQGIFYLLKKDKWICDVSSRKDRIKDTLIGNSDPTPELFGWFLLGMFSLAGYMGY